ncbi:MAG: cobyric acid synthase CobQ, partial [Aquincola sp.]|nr:cobyric acid synthase CobQ [Aquincola sp.]
LLGQRLDDPLGLEGGQPGSTPGLAVLPIATQFEPAKQLTRRQHRFGALQGAWAPLSHLAIEAYEIHLGRSQLLPAEAGAVAPQPALPEAPTLGWQQGNVLALYLHGLFESPDVLQALFGRAPRSLDAVFDGLADVVDAAFEPGVLWSLLDPPIASSAS